jgi:hypothetical protein
MPSPDSVVRVNKSSLPTSRTTGFIASGTHRKTIAIPGATKEPNSEGLIVEFCCYWLSNILLSSLAKLESSRAEVDNIRILERPPGSPWPSFLQIQAFKYVIIEPRRSDWNQVLQKRTTSAFSECPPGSPWPPFLQIHAFISVIIELRTPGIKSCRRGQHQRFSHARPPGSPWPPSRRSTHVMSAGSEKLVESQHGKIPCVYLPTSTSFTHDFRPGRTSSGRVTRVVAGS